MLYNSGMEYPVPRYLILIFSVILILLITGGCATKKPVVIEQRSNHESDQYVLSAEEMAKDGQLKTSNFFYKKAINTYEKLQVWDKAIRCYIKIGDNFQKMDDVESALGRLNTALKLTRTHLGYQHLELAKSYQRLAYKYLVDNKLDKSLELYQKSLAIQLEILGNNHPEVAKTYNQLSRVYHLKNDTAAANLNYIRSYGIKLRHHKEVPQDIDKKYMSYDGETFKKDEYKEARNRFNRSLEEYEKSYGQNKPLFALIYDQIGILYALEADYENALEYLQKAFNIRLEVYGEGSPEVGTGYQNIGICLRLKGDLEDAEKLMRSALNLKSKRLGEFHPDTATAYFQLGRIYFQRNDLDEALEYYQKALIALVPDFRSKNIADNPPLDYHAPRDKLLEILNEKAKTLRLRYISKPQQTSDLYNAYASFLHLSELVELMRQGYSSEDFKLLFSEKIHTIFQVYRQGINTAMQLYDLTEDPRYKETAFIFSEKSRAGILAEALAESRAMQFAGIPEAMLKKERELKKSLTYFDTYLQKEFNSENPDPDKIKKLEERYHNLTLEYRRLIGYFETDFPKYYHLKYKPVEVDISRIQKSLEPGHVLIEYFIGSGVLYIFVLTNDKLEVVRQPLAENLNAMVETYIRSIKIIEEGPFLWSSQILYQLLLKPVRSILVDCTKLVIIPDGPLHTIPFESIAADTRQSADLSQLDYMINHYSFSYHYSANLWLHSVSKNRQNQTAETAFLGFAPVFDEPAAQGYTVGQDYHSSLEGDEQLTFRKSSPGDEHEVSRLPATEDEVHAIIDLFRSQRKRAAGFFHGDATEENFKASVKEGYNLIHVATHSLKDQGEDGMSGLIFSPPDPNNAENKEDGILYSGEIYNLDLDAELVVLSSCESGVGRLVKGEGIMALNRGFFYSGIRNIIFSLWKVEDRSTSRLMIAFYRNILKGLPYSSALRKAKQQLIKDPYTAFPKYWSGFILVGR
jgi:CHAT domain-containing protein